MEEWRDIEGYEGYYQVSSEGRVRSLDREISAVSKYGKEYVKNLKGHMVKFGYSRKYYNATLFKDGTVSQYLVHKLVAFAFPEICGEYFVGAEINHKDENTHNNAAINLEFCTRDYNYSYGTGRERAHKAKKRPIIQMDLKGNEIMYWFSTIDAATELGIERSGIRKCLKGYMKTSNGYKWKYADKNWKI